MAYLTEPTLLQGMRLRNPGGLQHVFFLVATMAVLNPKAELEMQADAPAC